MTHKNTYFMYFFLSRDFCVAAESATRGLFILSFKIQKSHKALAGPVTPLNYSTG